MTLHRTSVTVNDYPRKIGDKSASVEFKAEPLNVTTDADVLGGPIAGAVSRAVSEAIAGVTAQASPATIKRREQAARAVERGVPWAVERYKGRRPGSVPGGRLLNDSGLLAELTAVPQGGGAFHVATVDNRLDGIAVNAEEMTRLLLDHVPMLRDTARILETREVREATAKTARAMVRKGPPKAR